MDGHMVPAERQPREFHVGQFVFQDPNIYDFYDVLAEAVLETQREDVPPIRIRVRTEREGQLLRVRLRNIIESRCRLSPWHWCATKFTREEPNVVYVWIAELASPADFMGKYRLFPAARVMQMMEEPKISVKKLPAQRYKERQAFDIEE